MEIPLPSESEESTRQLVWVLPQDFRTLIDMCIGWRVKAALLALSIAAPFVIFLSACGSPERKAEAGSRISEQTPTVAVSRAVLRNLSRDIVLTAEFIPFQEVDVMAKVSGYVKEIRVDVGDHVRQGQPLATIEAPEMQDDMTRAQATID